MIEVERKFRLSSKQRQNIEEDIKAKYGDVPTSQQSDIIFLHGINSFDSFKPGMPVMRLRTIGQETLLAYKRVINDAGDRLEHELAVSSAETMKSILEEMGYQEATSVSKSRVEVKDGSITITLDDVEKLGSFLGVEIVADEGSDLEETESRLMKVAIQYGLTSDSLEPLNYDQLIAKLPKNSK